MASDLPNATESVERVYAQSLFEIVDEQGQADAVRDELLELGQLIQNQPELARLLDSRVLRSETLATSIQAIFQGRVSDVVYRFIQVLNAKGRLAVLPGVIRAFEHLVEDKHGLVQVDVYVAATLDESQAQRVAQNIGQVIDRQVVLRQHVDESLIGGLKLRVGDRLIDGSAATQLRILRQRIIEEGRDKGRIARASA